MGATEDIVGIIPVAVASGVAIRATEHLDRQSKRKSVRKTKKAKHRRAVRRREKSRKLFDLS